MSTPEPSSKPSEDLSSLLTTVAIIGGAVAAVVIALFWFVTTPEYRSRMLGSFIALIVIVFGALLAAFARPRQVGHGLAGLFGAASLIAGLFSFGGSLPALLSLVLVAMGGAITLMTIKSLQRSRPAWSFLAALLGVMAVCTLFGAPKVRNLLEVNMLIALLVPGLLSVTCAALAMIAEDYRETELRRRR